MKKLLPLLAALLLLLSGCVEYDEELWLKPDGSGRAKLRLVHQSYYSNTQTIINKLEKPGIHLTDIKVKQSKANMIYEIEFSFDSIEAFNNVNDQISAADFWGQITLSKNPIGNIVFRRKISLGGKESLDQLPDDLSEGLNEMPTETDSMDMSDEDYVNSQPDDNDILEGIYKQQQIEYPTWTYKLHVPWKIIHAGDNYASIDPKKKTVSWKFDTEKLWNGQEQMIVEMKKGLDWIVYALMGIAAALVTFFVLWMIRINRRSHLHDAIKHREERERQQNN